MKHLQRSILILTTASLLISIHAYAALVDKIRAIVNDEVVCQSEIDRLLYPIYMRYRNIYKGEELDKHVQEAGDEILSQLINDRLILSQAKKLGIAVGAGEINQRIDELKSRFPGEDGLMKSLKEQGLSINDIRDQYKEQLMIEKTIDYDIRRSIQIMPQEAESYYRKHIDEFKESEQTRVSSILIRLRSERTSEQSLKLAVTVLQRLKDGADFIALAKNYSEGTNAEDGGDMGWVRRGQMVDKVDKAVFKLEIGEVSDLVKSSLGYHIFKCFDKNKGRVISLAEARPRIMDAIYRRKIEERFGEWLEELRKDAFISIK